jgi:hypothetical protein
VADTRPEAVSTKIPVGSPSAFRMISPPGGSGVAEVTPAISMAMALAKLACPDACLSRTGLSGDAADRASCVWNPRTAGSGAGSHLL